MLCKMIGHAWLVTWSPVRYECRRCGCWRYRGSTTIMPTSALPSTQFPESEDDRA